MRSAQPRSYARGRLVETASLPADGRYVLVSDLHIGDGSGGEPFGRKDALFRHFLDRVASRADALVIAGDGFDIAQAWRIERVYERHQGLIDDLVALSGEMPIHYLRGNHEGNGRALARALPFEFSLNMTIGDRILVEHGNVFDPHCQPGDRAAWWATRLHARLETLISSPIRIPMRKHYCWSTRLGHWVFFHFGLARHLISKLQQRAGWHEAARAAQEFLDYWGRGEWGDMNGLLRAAEYVLSGSDVDVLVCGHSHQPGRVRFDAGEYVNTGSWAFDQATYALYEDGRFSVRQFGENRVFEREEYHGVLGPHRDKSFFDWWDTFYRGWFRYDVDLMHAVCGVEPAKPSRPADAAAERVEPAA